MSKVRVHAIVALILATVLIGAGASAAVGYVEQRQYVLDLSAPTSVKCDQNALITARITSVKNGKLIANQAVSWSLILKQSGGDRLSRSTSVTNRQGLATVKLTFGPKAGQRIVKATIPGVKSQVTVRCRGGLG
jgi:hypothetical protein